MVVSLLVFCLLYLGLINFAAFAAFGLDKRAAVKGGWRVRERSLLSVAFLGGWPGAKLGQRVFRHKTRKQPFAARLNLVPLWQAGAAGLVVLLLTPLGHALIAALSG